MTAPSVALLPVDLADPVGRSWLVAFLTTNRFPFHVTPAPTRDGVERRIADGDFSGPAHALFRVEADGAAVGMVALDDLDDGAPLIDVRLAERARGRGLGARRPRARGRCVRGVPRRRSARGADPGRQRRDAEGPGPVRVGPGGAVPTGVACRGRCAEGLGGVRAVAAGPPEWAGDAVPRPVRRGRVSRAARSWAQADGARRERGSPTASRRRRGRAPGSGESWIVATASTARSAASPAGSPLRRSGEGVRTRCRRLV